MFRSGEQVLRELTPEAVRMYTQRYLEGFTEAAATECVNPLFDENRFQELSRV